MYTINKCANENDFVLANGIKESFFCEDAREGLSLSFGKLMSGKNC